MTDTLKAAYKIEAFNREGRKLAEETTPLGGPIEIEDVFETAVKYDIHTYRISVIEVETSNIHIETNEA